MTIVISQASLADVDALTPLFDAYRQFYGKLADPGLARAFLLQRLERSESVVFLARDEERAIGFTQLYPSFSSVGAARLFVLNDLYVDKAAEGRGAGLALLRAAEAFAREEGAVRLSLSTAVANHRAQDLYARAGWSRNDNFLAYDLTL